MKEVRYQNHSTRKCLTVKLNVKKLSAVFTGPMRLPHLPTQAYALFLRVFLKKFMTQRRPQDQEIVSHLRLLKVFLQ